MSTAANPNHSSIATNSRAAGTSGNHTHAEPAYTNGHQHHHHHHDVGGAPSNSVKKGKQKKATDPNEASKLIAAKISQLELDAAGDKEQEAEIEREVKKANRELNNYTARMDDMQKIEVLQKRVTEHLADMKRLERDNIKNKKRGDMLQKEKDLARTEQSKTNTLKDKLEKLCRELQRENNRLKNENKMLQDSEKENHTIWDDKFQGLLFELQDAQEQKDHPQAQVVNIEIEDLFKQRFKSLIDQYDLRELHFHSLLRSKELEVQFNIARYDKEKKAAEAETQRSRSLNSQVMTFSKTETELRSQLNIYVEKFKQVEDTLNNSNDLFLTFRKEMEEMSKKTKRLEKENSNLTRKHDLTNSNILKMAEERSKTNMEMDDLRKKSEKLRSIIEQMQKQGRGLPNGMVEPAGASMQGEYAEHEGEEESEYYDDDDAEEFDEDTEEEILHETPATYGPVPPPMTMPMGLPVNGVMASNGIRH